VTATGLREYHIENVDGGGLRLSGVSHPVVRQHLDVRGSLRFRGVTKSADHLACEIWAAHVKAVDDWIPPDRYLPSIPTLAEILAAGRGILCRGPRFLLRQYGTVLKRAGIRVTIATSSRRSSRRRARLLHFGQSFVVAANFEAEVERSDAPANKRLQPPARARSRERRG
jgi:hypothetical protein